ncbi:hypothetical protein WK39_27405 [Burkholderia cepacia]|uniref:VRR-NUC domain-containing protein n=1 Tax=Burkholderia cepacia TaxID=292 RepID=UPI00075364F7|nr:VRR-NUC domain-containing protein [Burkholderia cepacia]KVS51675.1 hypothetical protein WK39_27405 [Burkholderia cepacia]KVS69890.1 hypothetical protein WK40_04640 [Burkholderia cepacia]
MSGDGKWSLGGTASGDGQTSKVYLKSGFTADDKAKLCALMCHCKDNAGKSADGRDLRQVCVANQLKSDDKNYTTSEYKAEQKYNMATDPPEPIMSPNTPNKPHGYLPRWIQDSWVGEYLPGVGNVRIPDVVVVKDPAAIPTQDNLRAVVEMKFDGDTYSTLQRMSDLRIAGADAEPVLLTTEKCGCGRKRKQEASETETAPETTPKAAPWDPLQELDPLGDKARDIMRPPSTPVPPPGGSPGFVLF